MAKATPGNPKVDTLIQKSVATSTRLLKKKVRNLNLKALHDIKSMLYLSLSVCEKYIGVRQLQDTSMVGGKRRHHRKPKSVKVRINGHVKNYPLYEALG